jgi:hypothetical protein
LKPWRSRQGFILYSQLQVLRKWRDPDSNRGYHGFQLRGLCARLLLIAT